MVVLFLYRIILKETIWVEANRPSDRTVDFGNGLLSKCVSIKGEVSKKKEKRKKGLKERRKNTNST